MFCDFHFGKRFDLISDFIESWAVCRPAGRTHHLRNIDPGYGASQQVVTKPVQTLEDIGFRGMYLCKVIAKHFI